MRAVVGGGALGVPTITEHMADLYKRRIHEAGRVDGWRCAVWPSRSMAIMMHPTGVTWAVNLDQNAWMEMDVDMDQDSNGASPTGPTCPCVSGDRLLFGTQFHGIVKEGWVGGRDEVVIDGRVETRGMDCECRMVPSDLAEGTDFKFPSSMTSVWNARVVVRAEHGVLEDLDSPLPEGVVRATQEGNQEVPGWMTRGTKYQGGLTLRATPRPGGPTSPTPTTSPTATPPTNTHGAGLTATRRC